MTTTISAPRLLADAIGEPIGVVEAVARALRPSLFPLSNKGGGRGLRHLRPQHLTALAFGVALHAIARPTADELPELVHIFLRLETAVAGFATPPQFATNGVDPLADMLEAWWSHQLRGRVAAAGEAFAGLIDWLVQPAGQDLRALLLRNGATMELAVDTLPDAILRFWRDDGTQIAVLFDRLRRGMVVGDTRPGAIRKTAALRIHLICALADAWADFLQHHDEAVLAPLPFAFIEDRDERRP